MHPTKLPEPVLIRALPQQELYSALSSWGAFLSFVKSKNCLVHP